MKLISEAKAKPSTGTGLPFGSTPSYVLSYLIVLLLLGPYGKIVNCTPRVTPQILTRTLWEGNLSYHIHI